MTREQVKKLVIKNNEMIDFYINEELPRQLNARNGRIKVADWFKAQTLINDQGFYEKSMGVLRTCQAAGYDVRIDMQSNKLVWHDGGIY